MDSEGWARLSEWHNAWLDASPEDRERLQRPSSPSTRPSKLKSGSS